MKLTLFIENGEKTVYFDESFVVKGSRPQIMLKKATVFWNYNNVEPGPNNSVSFDSNEETVPEGYLNFDALEEFTKKLAETHNGVVEFRRKVHSGESEIKSSKDLRLGGKIGPLLGFGENDVITGSNLWVGSPNQVDINRGLRYVEILCDAVESGESLNNGKRSDLISTLPITSEQSLKGSVVRYNDIESKVEIQNGIYNKMTFKVRGNNGSENIGAVLLELYIG